MNEDYKTNDYVIEPWDHLMMTQSSDGSVHDQYVPPELEELARQVMRQYDMNVSSMTLITAKPDKGGAIWRIDTDKGPRSIKVLHRMPNRSLFSISAQDYLVQQGARVPALIPTISGDLYVNAGGKSWIVTEWVEPLTPVSKTDMTGVQDLCRGLGEFHRLSVGFTPPFGAVKASRLYRWPQHYEKIMTKLTWFEDIANIYSEFPASSVLLSMLPQIKAEASDYYMMFRDSAYERMIGMGEPYWGLAHQDYGWSNGQMGPGGIWIIDLDGVAYDIPIRDLRKLITSTMVDNGGWDITWVRAMIEAYHEGNPIDRETFELLLLDMAFPNEFYKHVKEIVYEPELFMPTELEPILNLIRTVEMNKWDVLNELRMDMDRYPSGDYPAAAEAAPIVMPIALPGAAAVEIPVYTPDTPLVPAAVAETGPAREIVPVPAAVASEAAVADYMGASAPSLPTSIPAAPFIAIPAAVVGTVSSRRRKRRRAARRRAGGRSRSSAKAAMSSRGNSRSRRRSRTRSSGRRSQPSMQAGSNGSLSANGKGKQAGKSNTISRASGKQRSASAGRMKRKTSNRSRLRSVYRASKVRFSSSRGSRPAKRKRAAGRRRRTLRQ